MLLATDIDAKKKEKNNNKISKNHKSQAGGITQLSVWLDSSLVVHVGSTKIGRKTLKDPTQRGIKIEPFSTALNDRLVIGRGHARVKRGCRSGQYPVGP